jgi:ElaB/YqjD/DUF883 family membrane-anchored ribosome-binding protein
MPNTVLERTGEHITDAVHKASRAADSVAEAAEDTINVLRRTGKQFNDAAEELLDDTTQRIKRHPAEAVVSTFAVGLIAGVLIGWMIGRK